MKTRMVVGRLKNISERVNGYAFLELHGEPDAIVSVRLMLPVGLWVTAEVEETPKGLRTRRVLMVAYETAADSGEQKSE